MRPLVVALLCVACAPTSRTAKNSEADAAAAVGPAVDTEGWVEVDAGPFTFRAPAEIVKEPVERC